MGKVISKNLANPSEGLGGRVITRFLIKRNQFLEENAVKLCNIQPHHKVLEVGFGPGLGLKAASKMVQNGPGLIYGTEISTRMLSVASKQLTQEIASGKVHLHLADVANNTFGDNTFDRIFHCNCYYFWPNIDLAVKELHRVIKPDGIMVATLRLESLRKLQKRDFMQFGNIDPDRYMTALKNNGFYDVCLQKYQDEHSEKKFEAIFAVAKK